MKRKMYFSNLVRMLVLALTGGFVMGTEEVAYEVVRTEDAIEIRDVAAYRVAEVTVEGKATQAGNRAFRPLFRYISGANRSQSKIAMTAPVTQAADSDEESNRWLVGFVMPASYTLESLPVPDDNAVRLREVPARRVAVIRYSGTWSEDRYNHHLRQLEAWMESQSLTAVGYPLWARYNAPFTPWFMRRNEIWIDIASSDTATADENDGERSTD